MAMDELSPSEVQGFLEVAAAGDGKPQDVEQAPTQLRLSRRDYPTALLDLISKAKLDLGNSWCAQRLQLVGDIEQAISNVKTSYRKATTVKIGGSVAGVLGGITAVVGYALLIPSFGAALPLALAGTAAAIGGGISGSAAAIGDAVVQSSISKKVKKDFETSKNLFDGITDDLAEGIAVETEKVVACGDAALNERLCKALKAALVELRYCRDKHTEVLTSLGMSEQEMSQLPATRRIGLLIQRLHELHDFAIECTARAQIIERCEEKSLQVNAVTTAGNEKCKEKSLQAKALASAEILHVGLNLIVGLVKIGMFGSAEGCNVPSGEAVATSLKPLLRGGIGVAEGVVQGAGKAGAVTAARVLGLVGSAAFAVVDLGLLIYYAKQMDDFRRHGRSPELVEELEAMKNTVELQLVEVRERCHMPCDED